MHIETQPRPTGGEAVRAAVLKAARRLFAARGTKASLREVADAAGVNLGLIHHYFGNKGDLISAVMEQGIRHGVSTLDHTNDAGEGLRTMLAGAIRNPDFSRLMLWMALDPASAENPIIKASYRPTRSVRKMSNPPPASDLHLALALSVVYAWPILRSEILDVLEVVPEERDGIDDRMADLLAEVVTGGRWKTR